MRSRAPAPAPARGPACSPMPWRRMPSAAASRSSRTRPAAAVTAARVAGQPNLHWLGGPVMRRPRHRPPRRCCCSRSSSRSRWTGPGPRCPHRPCRRRCPTRRRRPCRACPASAPSRARTACSPPSPIPRPRSPRRVAHPYPRCRPCCHPHPPPPPRVRLPLAPTPPLLPLPRMLALHCTLDLCCHPPQPRPAARLAPIPLAASAAARPPCHTRVPVWVRHGRHHSRPALTCRCSPTPLPLRLPAITRHRLPRPLLPCRRAMQRAREHPMPLAVATPSPPPPRPPPPPPLRISVARRRTRRWCGGWHPGPPRPLRLHRPLVCMPCPRSATRRRRRSRQGPHVCIRGWPMAPGPCAPPAWASRMVRKRRLSLFRLN
eukprot:m.124625 g.124625  ORF g.124625 m.124625 type:complete len:375 (-) comp14652_c3_seq2:164-1288(-)